MKAPKSPGWGLGSFEIKFIMLSLQKFLEKYFNHLHQKNNTISLCVINPLCHGGELEGPL